VRSERPREHAYPRVSGKRAAWRPLSLAVAVGVVAAPDSGAAEAGTAWTVNDISVEETVPGQEGAVNTRFEIGNNGDARITVRLHDPAHTRGTIVLIGGRWMLGQGFAPTPGKETQAMDVAALNSQLVIVLLNAVLPRGPPPPGQPRQVMLTEKNNPIRIATETAAAEYRPPWTVEGTVSVPAADAPVSYHLSFTWSAEEQQKTRIFAGTVSDSAPAVSFPDSMTLAGWSVRQIGPRRQASPGASAHAGAPPPPRAATVGELRKLP